MSSPTEKQRSYLSWRANSFMDGYRKRLPVEWIDCGKTINAQGDPCPCDYRMVRLDDWFASHLSFEGASKVIGLYYEGKDEEAIELLITYGLPISLA